MNQEARGHHQYHHVRDAIAIVNLSGGMFLNPVCKISRPILGCVVLKLFIKSEIRSHYLRM